MDLPPDLLLIHQPVRLRIMGVLYKHRDVRFTVLRDSLGLTDGNLASHATRLAEAGYIDSRRVLTNDGFEMRYRITRDGLDAFKRYLQTLTAYLADVAEPGPPRGEPHSAPDGGVAPGPAAPPA